MQQEHNPRTKSLCRQWFAWVLIGLGGLLISCRQSTPRKPTARETKSTAQSHSPKSATTRPKTRKRVHRYRPNIRQVGAAKEFRHIEIYQVKQRGRYAYACTIVQGFQIYDIKQPTRPRERGEFRFPIPYGGYGKPGCRYLALSEDGRTAYVTNSSNAFQPRSFLAAIDISKPSNPKIIRYFSDKKLNLGGVAAHKRRVFVAAFQQGVLALALTRPTSTSQTHKATTRPTTKPRQQNKGNKKGLQHTIRRTAQLALGNRAKEDPRYKLTLLHNAKGFQNAQSVTRHGKYLYIPDGPGGLKIARLEDNEAKHPPFRLVGHARTIGFARRVAIHRGHAFVSQGHSGFEIFDVRQPDKPTRIAHVPTMYSVVEIALQGHHAYVANWNDLRIYDVKTPSTPKLIAARALPKRKDTFRLPYEQSLTQIRNTSLAVKGDLLILGEWVGLRTLRFTPSAVPIASPSQTSLLWTWNTPPSRPTQRSFALQNIGQAPLTLTRLSVSRRAFELLGPKTRLLAPGARTTISVAYLHERKRASASGTLRIDTNDPHQPRIDIALSAASRDVRSRRHRDFRLEDLNGKRHALSALRGKVVLLSYFATF